LSAFKQTRLGGKLQVVKKNQVKKGIVFGLLIVFIITVLPSLTLELNSFSSAEDSSFILKWTATTGVSVSSGITPLCFDINHDGNMEVFVSGDCSPNSDKIYCIYGNNGTVKWSRTLQYSISSHCPMEIYDLNNDGKYEIIQPGPNALQVLHAEDGTI
jgi:outer membrane protein assembly factor BamB